MLPRVNVMLFIVPFVTDSGSFLTSNSDNSALNTALTDVVNKVVT